MDNLQRKRESALSLPSPPYVSNSNNVSSILMDLGGKSLLFAYTTGIILQQTLVSAPPSRRTLKARQFEKHPSRCYKHPASAVGLTKAEQPATIGRFPPRGAPMHSKALKVISSHSIDKYRSHSQCNSHFCGKQHRFTSA